MIFEYRDEDHEGPDAKANDDLILDWRVALELVLPHGEPGVVVDVVEVAAAGLHLGPLSEVAGGVFGLLLLDDVVLLDEALEGPIARVAALALSMVARVELLVVQVRAPAVLERFVELKELFDIGGQSAIFNVTVALRTAALVPNAENCEIF